MKKIFTLIIAGVLAASMLAGCNGYVEPKTNADNDEAKNEVVEEVLEDGFTYSKTKLIGCWETQDPLYGIYWGYRFNEDGTLDYVEDRMYNVIGIYECRPDGVHYSADGGENWDSLVMKVVYLSDDELTVDFDGQQTTFTRYEGELTEYMPDGWTYVEGSDEELGSDVAE